MPCTLSLPRHLFLADREGRLASGAKGCGPERSSFGQEGADYVVLGQRRLQEALVTLSTTQGCHFCPKHLPKDSGEESAYFSQPAHSPLVQREEVSTDQLPRRGSRIRLSE